MAEFLENSYLAQLVACCLCVSLEGWVFESLACHSFSYASILNSDSRQIHLPKQMHPP